MRTLYLECNMGAAGDMLMGALLELHPDSQDFVKRFNRLGIPGVKLEKKAAVKCGICGTHMKVTVNGAEEESIDVDHHGHTHEEREHNHSHTHDKSEHGHHHEDSHYGGENVHGHHHTSFHDIEHIVGQLKMSEKVKKDVIHVYELIAQAEGHAHGKPVEQIHFHEVGSIDAIADVVGVCMLMDEIAPQKIVASPIHVGSGNIKCAHGILPVPAPATAYILKDVPIYSGSVSGELCTPTGAALLKYFVEDFSGMPVMQVEKIGYGMGKKDFEMANCVRAMLGTSEQKPEEIVELCCNLDDMTAENIGFASQLMMEQGALDVYTTSIGMKKNRLGVMLTCMCRAEDKDKFLKLIFRHTTTLGVREYTCNRYRLDRDIRVEKTKYGDIHIKTSKGYGVTREKIEYEDLAKISVEQSKSIEEIKRELKV